MCLPNLIIFYDLSVLCHFLSLLFSVLKLKFKYITILIISPDWIGLGWHKFKKTTFSWNHECQLCPSKVSVLISFNAAYEPVNLNQLTAPNFGQIQDLSDTMCSYLFFKCGIEIIFAYDYWGARNSLKWL